MSMTFKGLERKRKLDYDVTIRDKHGRVTEVVHGRVQADGITVVETSEKVS